MHYGWDRKTLMNQTECIDAEISYSGELALVIWLHDLLVCCRFGASNKLQQQIKTNEAKWSAACLLLLNSNQTNFIIHSN